MRFIFLVFLIFSVFQPVFAYERVKRTINLDTEQRRADAISPQGILYSGFAFFPFLGVGEEFNDNIFKSEALVLDDFITHLSPGFNIKSDWNRHQLALQVNSDLAFYAQHSGQNHHDVTVDFKGRLDVLRNSALRFSTFFGSLHANRQSIEQQGGVTPTFYRVLDIDVAYKHQFNRFSIEGALDVSRRDYDNVALVTGTIRNNQARNRWDYNPFVRFSYEVQSGYEAFVKMRYTKVNYDQAQGINGYERSSQGGDAVVGLAFDATGLITGDIALGYRYRAYDDARLNVNQGLTGGLSLQWDVTPLMTIHSEVTQDIGETIQPGVSGTSITAVNLGVEHELLRSLLLKLDGGYAFWQYRGFDPSRYDAERIEHRYFVSFAGKYTFSRYFYMDLAYKFSARQSNYVLRGYDQNQIFLNFVARM